MDETIHLVNVFTCNGQGGNLAPIVLDAHGLTDADMRDIARRYERESAFAMVHEDSKVDFQLRFFVPEHEMEMCGHATVGTAWLMHNLQTTSKSVLDISTKSGYVSTRCTERDGQTLVFVSQPQGKVTDVFEDFLIEEILAVLRIRRNQLAQWPIRNACTSRMKTVIPLKDVDTLNNLRPDFSKVKGLCERLGSTGLYPYAVVQSDKTPIKVEARQFPKASGYPEDAATGIAAAALSYALAASGQLHPGQHAMVYQGRAMGCLSEINVQLDQEGCWIGGACMLESRLN
ncbi:phenazine biosynthesis protein PhzF family [Exophiala viscosa]|uniref:Phenazine biosynthesis protein PhzF family n=1 Tax=Exophiala viscosa TaxID=2486360 RepID=A0AAN6IGI1_9EURO|nr:phenazine biosynthesis protein PhzF family [Exophiala viscosa]KAI1629772.1 phenazine biosynthesis protein PhzF family [Exophiala viscosa]